MTSNFDSWEYVPGTEHHGPYVTTTWGKTVADCYTMSNPEAASVRNGGTSYPINHCGEDAEANARLIAAAPELLESLLPLLRVLEGARNDEDVDCTTQAGGWLCGEVMTDAILSARAAIAKATGEASDV